MHKVEKLHEEFKKYLVDNKITAFVDISSFEDEENPDFDTEELVIITPLDKEVDQLIAIGLVIKAITGTVGIAYDPQMSRDELNKDTINISFWW